MRGERGRERHFLCFSFWGCEDREMVMSVSCSCVGGGGRGTQGERERKRERGFLCFSFWVFV